MDGHDARIRADGCVGQANFSTDLRGGVAADGQGNIYIVDTSNSLVRKYDPKTTLVSRVAGKGTNCTTASGLLDATGDGCPQLQTSFPSSPRGVGTDPYGNVFVAGYQSYVVNIECMAASPLCPNTAGLKQVGYQYRIAGCVGTVGGAATAPLATATTAGTEGDGSFASPFSNLAGDAAAGTTGTAAGGTCGTTQATQTVGMVNGARGVAADKYGNVYIAETGNTSVGLRYRLVLGPQTSTYFTGNNPLYAFLGNYTGYAGKVHVGYIYTIAGGFTSPGAGVACASGSVFTSTDAYGDGCPFYYSNMNGAVQGVAVDNYGNAIFSDTVHSLIRVLYSGGASAAANPMYAAIVANSPGVTPTAGNIYLLAGGNTAATSTFASTTPTLGNAVLLSNGIQRLNVGPGGNLYIGDTANAQALYYDIATGYIRQLFKNGTACAAHVTGSSNGDGCPGPAGFTVSTANAFGIAPDPLGNLYLADQANGLIRKVEAVSLIPTVVGSQTAAGAALTQTLTFHGPRGTANITVSTLNAPADVVVGTVTCPAANADTTLDCTVPVTFAPAQPGTRTANLSVQALNSSNAVLGSAVVPVSGNGVGTALVTDTATPTVNASNGLTPVTAAIDGAGNLYTVDNGSGQVIKANVNTGSNTALGAAPATPVQTAVDMAGNVYITSAGSASYTEFVQNTDGSYTANAITNPAITLPQAIAVDASGNQYIADKTTGNLYEVAVGTAFATAQPPAILATGFKNPVGVALDGSGNLFVADTTLAGVYKITYVNGAPTTTLYAGASAAAVTVAITPSAIAADAAGNVYVQDSSSKSILAIPFSQAGPTTTTVLTGLTTPSGVAVDGNGTVYSVDSGAPALRQVLRNALTFGFGTSTALTFSGTITNAGNTTATGYQAAGLDTGDFPVTSVSPSACFTSAAIAPGSACAITAAFTPTSGTGAVSSTVAYAPASSTTGTLKFTGTKSGAAVTTTTSIGNETPAVPVYAASGTEVTFTVSVAASDSSTPSGAVTVSLDGGATNAYTLSSGMVSVPLAGLAAGGHSIAAAYASQGGLTGSTAMTVNFTIAQATTTVTWNPSATTQQYSAAIGAGVLDATAVVTGTSTPVAGYFLYSATPNGGAASTIHAASFLPIGTFGLSVQFVPIDSADFSGNTASVPSYTVTKASTTAGLGATQTLVAADGTGNYTSIQAAINTIGATAGGSVYVKPGTYTGDVTVVQPNVSLRGLGGDPTAVIMTHSGGAFGGSGVYQYAGEFNTSQANGAQLPAGSSLFNGDEGSATLVVAKGVNTAVSTATLIPNGFYGENFTLLNTYDTDTVTTTSTYLPSVNAGTCTANQGPSRTYNDLFNNSLLCASQALAIWTTADLSVMNNIYSTSLQDTIYASSQGSGSNGYVPARQYWFRGKVTGTVDYIFGDAAAVFDYTSIYSVQHGLTTGGTITIEAQNKAVQTGSANDYLSGYVMNSDVFTSSPTGLTAFYFGRPYGTYSTYLMLNSYVDQVTPAGYIEFSNGTTNLPTSTYAEYNDIPYTDPTAGSADVNGVIYNGTAANAGAGVTGTREAVSADPGTPEAGNAIKTQLTAAQATLYYPAKFLGTTVPATVSPVANFNPNTALAANVNAFTTGGTVASITGGTSVTILMRPQTPGLGAVTNGVYTIPTGSYSLRDTFNGATTTVASGSLDASGEAYYTSSTLTAGAHSFVWTYSGDANFSGSTAAAYALQVSGTATTTTLAATTGSITYGQSAGITATVTGGATNGSVTLTIDGATTQTAPVTSGQAVFSVSGLQAGAHSFSASYSGSTQLVPSSTASNLPLTVNQATLTVTASCANRAFGAQNTCSANVTGYQYSDSAATVFTGTPTGTSNATPSSPAGTYTATPAGIALTAFGNTNYVLAPVNTTFTVTGNSSAPQVILFRALPNFPAGTYQLTARTTSGLPVTYSVSGNATVSGSTLTVNAGGGTVTVTASTAADPNGDYAAATPVARSFTAQ